MPPEDDSSCLASTISIETATFGHLSARRRCLCRVVAACAALPAVWQPATDCLPKLGVRAGREILELVLHHGSMAQWLTLRRVRFSLHATWL